MGPCRRRRARGRSRVRSSGPRVPGRRAPGQPAARRDGGAGPRPGAPDLRAPPLPGQGLGALRTTTPPPGASWRTARSRPPPRHASSPRKLGVTGATLRPWGSRSTRTTPPAAWSTASRRPGRAGQACGRRGGLGRLDDPGGLDAHLADPAWPFVPDTRALGPGWRVTGPATTDGWGRYGSGMSDDNSARAIAAQHDSDTHRVTRHGPVGSLGGGGAARGVEPRRSSRPSWCGSPTTTTGSCWSPGRGDRLAEAGALLGVNRLSMPSADVAFDGNRRRPRHHHAARQQHAWPVVADASLSGPVSLGGGAHGVGADRGRGRASALGAHRRGRHRQPAGEHSRPHLCPPEPPTGGPTSRNDGEQDGAGRGCSRGVGRDRGPPASANSTTATAADDPEHGSPYVAGRRQRTSPGADAGRTGLVGPDPRSRAHPR